MSCGNFGVFLLPRVLVLLYPTIILDHPTVELLRPKRKKQDFLFIDLIHRPFVNVQCAVNCDVRSDAGSGCHVLVSMHSMYQHPIALNHTSLQVMHVIRAGCAQATQ